MPSSLPSLLERRGLIHGKESQKADHRGLAERYFEAGRYVDALEFFHKANDAEGIDRIRRHAIKEGDVFLLGEIERVTHEPILPETWKEAASNAERCGKLAFARKGFEKAGDADGVAKLADEE
jgi:hypothetical protein